MRERKTLCWTECLNQRFLAVFKGKVYYFKGENAEKFGGGGRVLWKIVENFLLIFLKKHIILI